MLDRAVCVDVAQDQLRRPVDGFGGHVEEAAPDAQVVVLVGALPHREPAGVLVGGGPAAPLTEARDGVVRCVLPVAVSADDVRAVGGEQATQAVPFVAEPGVGVVVVLALFPSI